jgi:hypothetical protein
MSIRPPGRKAMVVASVMPGTTVSLTNAGLAVVTATPDDVV